MNEGAGSEKVTIKCPQCEAVFALAKERMAGMEHPRFRCKRCNAVFGMECRIDDASIGMNVEAQTKIPDTELRASASFRVWGTAAAGTLALLLAAGVYSFSASPAGTGAMIGTKAAEPSVVGAAAEIDRQPAPEPAAETIAQAAARVLPEAAAVRPAAGTAEPSVGLTAAAVNPPASKPVEAPAAPAKDEEPAVPALQTDTIAVPIAEHSGTRASVRLPALTPLTNRVAPPQPVINLLTYDDTQLAFALRRTDNTIEFIVQAKDTALRNAAPQFQQIPDPPRAVIDLPGMRPPAKPQVVPSETDVVQRVRIGKQQAGARLVLDLAPGVIARSDGPGGYPLKLVLTRE